MEGRTIDEHSITKDYRLCKKNGVLETIINTNATYLKGNYAEEIISSGLDLLIYSFDGGSKKTYDKYRVGRFKQNKFENILENIKNFHLLKKKKNHYFQEQKYKWF